jgi:hypothetical protein
MKELHFSTMFAKIWARKFLQNSQTKGRKEKDENAHFTKTNNLAVPKIQF